MDSSQNQSPMMQKKTHWSVSDQVCLIDCMDKLQRYTFTEEDFVKVSQMMKQIYNIDRTKIQCKYKFSELNRCHRIPIVCQFFEKIRRKYMMPVRNYFFIGKN